MKSAPSQSTNGEDEITSTKRPQLCRTSRKIHLSKKLRSLRSPRRGDNVDNEGVKARSPPRDEDVEPLTTADMQWSRYKASDPTRDGDSGTSEKEQEKKYDEKDDEDKERCSDSKKRKPRKIVVRRTPHANPSTATEPPRTQSADASSSFISGLPEAVPVTPPPSRHTRTRSLQDTPSTPLWELPLAESAVFHHPGEEEEEEEEEEGTERNGTRPTRRARSGDVPGPPPHHPAPPPPFPEGVRHRVADYGVVCLLVLNSLY